MVPGPQSTLSTSSAPCRRRFSRHASRPPSPRNGSSPPKTGKTTADLDPRPGGKYTITRTTGRRQYVATGEYLEVEAPHRLAFTFGMPQFAPDFDTVTITITPAQNGSRLHLKHDGLRPGYEKSTISGWEKTLGLLDGVLESATDGRK